MKKHSRKYNEASTKVDHSKMYGIDDAIKLVKDTAVTKFDSTVEVAVRLNLDSKKADQQIRGVLMLPHGTGKTKKVMAIVNASKEAEAKKAGADYIGGEELIEKITKENFFDFDVIVATPDMMPKLGKVAKVLGPKGLMPNPKTGTVTEDVEKKVKDLKAGELEYRSDTFGNVHGIIGKSSFSEKDLKENFKAYMDTIVKAKPQSLKGKYIKSIHLTTTMGPSVKVDETIFDN